MSILFIVLYCFISNNSNTNIDSRKYVFNVRLSHAIGTKRLIDNRSHSRSLNIFAQGLFIASWSAFASISIKKCEIVMPYTSYDQRTLTSYPQLLNPYCLSARNTPVDIVMNAFILALPFTTKNTRHIWFPLSSFVPRTFRIV